MHFRRRVPLAVTIAVLLGLLLAGCTGEPAGEGVSASDPPPAKSSVRPLQPTIDDGLSPSFRPGAPERSVVGTGHVLTGSVKSTDGSPIAGARLELWPEYEGRGHPDEARATVYTDSAGRYRFVCDPPEHVHMRITADGYVGIAQNGYHPAGRTEGVFDIVLSPE